MNQSPFQLFWENSKLNALNALSFFLRIEKDNNKSHVTPNLYYNTPDIKLSHGGKNIGELLSILRKRRTRYNISSTPLNKEDIGAIFSALGGNEEQKRNIPSAGGKNPIELYMILFASELFEKPTLVYYNTDNHSLSSIKNVPNWETLRGILGGNLEQLTGSPSFCAFIVSRPGRTMEKYGERGGRFVLLESGALMQNISIVCCQLGIGSIILGGYYDDEVSQLLGIDKNFSMISSVIIGGYFPTHEIS